MSLFPPLFLFSPPFFLLSFLLAPRYKATVALPAAKQRFPNAIERALLARARRGIAQWSKACLQGPTGTVSGAQVQWRAGSVEGRVSGKCAHRATAVTRRAAQLMAAPREREGEGGGAQSPR